MSFSFYIKFDLVGAAFVSSFDGFSQIHRTQAELYLRGFKQKKRLIKSTQDMQILLCKFFGFNLSSVKSECSLFPDECQ